MAELEEEITQVVEPQEEQAQIVEPQEEQFQVDGEVTTTIEIPVQGEDVYSKAKEQEGEKPKVKDLNNPLSFKDKTEYTKAWAQSTDNVTREFLLSKLEIYDEAVAKQQKIKESLENLISKPKYKEITVENFYKDSDQDVEKFISSIKKDNPNFKFEKKASDNIINMSQLVSSFTVTNISTGEELDFMFPTKSVEDAEGFFDSWSNQVVKVGEAAGNLLTAVYSKVTGDQISYDQGLKLYKDATIDKLNRFLKSDNIPNPEAGYINQMTGFTPIKNDLGELVYEVEGEEYSRQDLFSNIKTIDKLTLETMNGPAFDFVKANALGGFEDFGNLELDYDNLSYDNQQRVKNKIFREWYKSTYNTALAILGQEEQEKNAKNFFNRIYDSQYFKANLNAQIKQVAANRIMQDALDKKPSEDEFRLYKGGKELEMASDLTGQAKKVFDAKRRVREAEIAIEDLKLQRPEITDKDPFLSRKNLELKQAQNYLKSLTTIKSEDGSEKDISPFDEKGYWKLDTKEEEDSFDQSILDSLIFMDSLSFDKDKPGFSDRESLTQFYDTRLYISQNIDRIGEKEKLKIKVTLPKGNVKESSNELVDYALKHPEKYNKNKKELTLSYNDFFNFAKTGVKDFEGFFDEASKSVKLADLEKYKIWREEKLENDGALKGLYTVLNIGIDPATIERSGGMYQTAKGVLKSFLEGSLYGDFDAEKADKIINTMIGADSNKLLDQMKAGIDEYNASDYGQKNPINFTKDQLENFEATINELVGLGFGSMVPMMLEMFAITLATEGVGLSAYMAELPTVWRFLATGALEEGKMLLSPTANAHYQFGTGATFGWMGYGTNYLPKLFANKYQRLRPIYEKVIKTGWTGALSVQTNNFVQEVRKEIMYGDEGSFSAKFEEVYGDLFSSEGDEKRKHFVKELIVDGATFAMTGLFHTKNLKEISESFKSAESRLKTLDQLNKYYWAKWVEVGEKLTPNLVDRASEGTRPPSINDRWEVIKNNMELFENNPEAIKEFKKLDQIASDIQNVNRMINQMDRSYRFNTENPKLNKNVNQLTNSSQTTLNAKVQEHNSKNPGDKLKNCEITNEIGEGEVFRNNNNFGENDRIKVDIEIGKNGLPTGKYKVLIDRNKFKTDQDLGTAIMHEIAHVMKAESWRRNPGAKTKMENNPLGSKISDFTLKLPNGNNIKASDYFKLVAESYKDKPQDIQEEFETNLIEVLMNPDSYTRDPYFAGSLLNKFKVSIEGYYRKYGQKAPTFRNVEDLVRELQWMGRELNKTGFLSPKSMELLNKITSGDFEKLGDISINQVLANQLFIESTSQKAQKDIVKESGKKNVKPENVSKPSRLVADKNRELQNEILSNLDPNTNKALPNDKQAYELVTNNMPVVNSIVKNIGTIAAKFNIEGVKLNDAQKQDLTQELYIQLIQLANGYNANLPSSKAKGPEGYFGRFLAARIPKALDDIGFFVDMSKVAVENEAVLDNMMNEIKSSTEKWLDTNTGIAGSGITGTNITTRIKAYTTKYSTKPDGKVIERQDKVKADKIADGITNNLEFGEIGRSITTYRSTPAAASEVFYEDFGITSKDINKKIKNPDGSFKVGSTRFTGKQLDKSREFLKNNLRQIHSVLPEGYVPYNEYYIETGESITPSDKVAGTATGVQTKLEHSPFYVKTKERVSDAVGLTGYRKRTWNEISENPDIQQEILDYYLVDQDLKGPDVSSKDVANLSTKFQSLIYQTDKGLSNRVAVEYVQKNIEDLGLLNDLRGGQSTTRASRYVEGTMRATFGWDKKKYNDFILAYISDPSKVNANESQVFQATIIQQAASKAEITGKRFTQYSRLDDKNYIQPKSFRSKTWKPGEKQKAQAAHNKSNIEVAVNFMPKEIFADGGGPVMGMLRFGGKDRLVGELSGSYANDLFKSVNSKGANLKDIKDPDIKKAWTKAYNLYSKLEQAKSTSKAIVKESQMGQMKLVAQGDQIVRIEGTDGKVYIYDPLNKMKQVDGVNIIKGNSIDSKIEAIDKIFDKEVIEAARAFDYAFNLSLSKWYNTKRGTKEEGAAKDYMFRHFQMADSGNFTDRALAMYSSLYLTDGILAKEVIDAYGGEHITSMAQNGYRKYHAIVNDYYSPEFFELNNSGFFQALMPKQAQKYMDKLLGQNSVEELNRFLIGEGNTVPAQRLYNFIEGKMVMDIISERYAASEVERLKLKKENEVQFQKDMKLAGTDEVKIQNVKTENFIDQELLSNPTLAAETYTSANNLRSMASKEISTGKATEKVTADVFDVDDNLIKTKTKIGYTLKDGTKGELDAQEFNMYKEQLDKKGAKWDYSAFDKVIKEEYAGDWENFKRAWNRTGGKDTFLMTARAPGAKVALFEWLKSEGYEIPFENIITTEGTEYATGPLAGENKKGVAILGFYTGEHGGLGKRYNNINFGDDHSPNVGAVKFVTDQLDITGNVYTTLVKESRDIQSESKKYLGNSFNTKVEKYQSLEIARKLGEKKDGLKMMPYSNEDFLGLLYATLPKSNKKGQRINHLDFYNQNLINPYNRGIRALEYDKVNLMNDYNVLIKNLKSSKAVPQGLKKRVKIPGIDGKLFTAEDAVRVWMWNQTGVEKIPGLSNQDVGKMLDYVNSNNELIVFGNLIIKSTKGDGYSKPGKYWAGGTIKTDLLDVLNTTKRSKYLQEFLDNRDLIFTEEYRNTLRANLGNKYMDALDNMFARMESGQSRLFKGSKISNNIVDYISGSVGVTMFLNTKSAALQLISAGNSINWSWNNIAKVGQAMTRTYKNEQGSTRSQYARDMSYLSKSPYMRNRMGNSMNTQEAEDLANIANRKGGSAAVSWLLNKGYISKVTDGGAILLQAFTFTNIKQRLIDGKIDQYGRTLPEDYVNPYKNMDINNPKLDQVAMLEWVEMMERNQQSREQSKLGAQQTSVPGRLMLNYANTPIQYVRIQKRAFQDLAAGIDPVGNISKILYYGFIQNLMFNGLQQAVWADPGADVSEEEVKKYMLANPNATREEAYDNLSETFTKKEFDVMNGALNSTLRGFGLGGNAVATAKDVAIDLYRRTQKSRPEYVDALWKISNISPSIGSKISRLRQAAWQFDSKGRRQEMIDKGFSLDNPLLEASTNTVEALTNVPARRIQNKAKNLSNAYEELTNKEETFDDATDWLLITLYLAGYPEYLIDPYNPDRSKNKKIKGYGNGEDIKSEAGVIISNKTKKRKTIGAD